MEIRRQVPCGPAGITAPPKATAVLTILLTPAVTVVIWPAAAAGKLAIVTSLPVPIPVFPRSVLDNQGPIP